MRPFISYAKEDHAAAKQLCEDLKRAGLTPWLDVEHILGGQEWESAISEALRRSSHVIPLISKNSIDKVGYVQKEIRQALDRLDQFPPDAVFVIPVRLDESVPKHKRLTELQWIDLFPDYQSGLRRLLQSLAAPPGDYGLRASAMPVTATREHAAHADDYELSSLLSRYPKLRAIRTRLAEPSDACERYRDTIEVLVEAGRWVFNIGVARPAELLRADEEFLRSVRQFAGDLRESAVEIDAIREQNQKGAGDLIALVNPLYDVRQALYAAATATENLRDVRNEMRTSKDRRSYLVHPLYQAAANALNGIADEIEKAEQKRETDRRFFQAFIDQKKPSFE